MSPSTKCNSADIRDSYVYGIWSISNFVWANLCPYIQFTAVLNDNISHTHFTYTTPPSTRRKAPRPRPTLPPMELHRSALRCDERLLKLVNYFARSASYKCHTTACSFSHDKLTVAFSSHTWFIICALSFPLIQYHSNIEHALTASALQQRSQTSFCLEIADLCFYRWVN